LALSLLILSSYLIEKVNEFESLCLIQINEDSAIEFQVIIEQIENNLNGKDISQDELRKKHMVFYQMKLKRFKQFYFRINPCFL